MERFLKGLFFFVLLASNNSVAEDLRWGGVSNLSGFVWAESNPQIALSSDGAMATAVWSPTYSILSGSASISGTAATWGIATRVEEKFWPDYTNPQIALSSDGTKATAVWKHDYGLMSASAMVSGKMATWGDEKSLPGTGTFDDNPQIALSSDGTKATAVWKHHDGSTYSIQSATATISGNTATWSSTAADLSTYGQPATHPQIALSSDGTKATAVWQRYNGSHYIIQSASATISGNTATWGAPVNLSLAGQNAFVAQIALSSDGSKVTVVWRRDDGSRFIIQSVSATISGTTATWGSTVNLSDIWQHAEFPQIALSSDGTKATAVWRRSYGTSTITQSASAKISGNTAAWSDARTLSVTGQPANHPQIALSSDGSKAAAVWTGSNGSNYIIQSKSATIIGNTATWSAVKSLSAVGQDAGKPQIVVSSDGTKVTAVWLLVDGLNYVVQSKSAVEDSSCYVTKSSNGKTVTFCL